VAPAVAGTAAAEAVETAVVAAEMEAAEAVAVAAIKSA
jgi:hypothetical protein